MTESSYLYNVLNPTKRKKVIAGIVKLLRKTSVQFDAIAFTGNSGALVAPIIADRLKKSILMVRKDCESNHAYRGGVEGDNEAKAYIIIDDFWSTGDTMRTIINKIKGFNRNAKCVGFLSYSHDYGPTARMMDDELIIPAAYSNVGRDFGELEATWESIIP